MIDFYNRLQNTALRLITDKGVPCVIKSPSQQGGFDPTTGLPTPSTGGTTQDGQCVVLNYSDVVTNMPESLIKQTDKKILIAAKGVDIPQIGGTVTADDAIYTIVAVKDIKPATTALVYEVAGRE